VIRGLLYQLTGDQEVANTTTQTEWRRWAEVSAVTDPREAALLRRKAVEYLCARRAAGPDQPSPTLSGERLRRSLELCTGLDISDEDLGLLAGELGIGPWARAFTWTSTPEQARVEDFPVVVIGAGMGGLCAAIQLRKAGFPFTVLEKNAGVGGT